MRYVLTMLLLALCGVAANAQNLKAGFAVKDITPKIGDIKGGIKTQGWGAIADNLQQGDKLFVRAMAMRDKNNKLLVIVTADTCKFHEADAYMLKEWFEKTFGVSRWQLIINASHTHQAPYWYPNKSKPYSIVYRKIILTAVKGAISEAIANIKTPVSIQFAKLKIRKNMVFNKITEKYSQLAQKHWVRKRNLAEKYRQIAKSFDFADLDFPVMIFCDAKTSKILCFLWSIAAHPTFVAGGGLRGRKGGMNISSHAPGAVARALRKAYGKDVICMFAQGAAGDLKMDFPDLSGKVSYNRFKKTGLSAYVWNEGKDKGKVLTQQQYLNSLNAYGAIFVDIIKQGFKDHKFKEIGDISLRIAGREIKIPLTLKKPPKKSKLGQLNRCYWHRPEGSVESYEKIIADKNSTEMQKYRACEALGHIYDREHAAYQMWVTKVMFNKHFQIVAMSNEICSEIGMEIKKYYQSKGVETVFWGYSPFGTPYYPSNKHKAAGTYQGSFMHPDATFDFNKFALDSVIRLKPE